MADRPARLVRQVDQVEQLCQVGQVDRVRRFLLVKAVCKSEHSHQELRVSKGIHNLQDRFNHKYRL